MIYDIVIVGGGVVGLTLAALSAASNLNILVIEKNIINKPLDDYDLRCSALNLHSCKIFEELNLFDKILANAKYGAFKQIKIYTEKETLDFAANDIKSPYLGYILQNQAVINELLNYLSAYKNITLLSFSAQRIDPLTSQLLLADGRIINYKFLVLADGRNSQLRNLLGIELYSHDYQDSALVATVKTTNNCSQIASQFFKGQAILAFLPLASGHFSIVLSQPKHLNAQLISDKQKLALLLAEISNYKFGHIEIISAVASFDLLAQHASQYVVAENIVLVGDSAHSIHPLAGQGLNLGLNDVACLAKLIKQQQLNYRALRQYERELKLQNSVFLHSMSALRALFKTSMPANLALKALSHLPQLKTALIKSAVFGWT